MTTAAAPSTDGKYSTEVALLAADFFKGGCPRRCGAGLGLHIIHAGAGGLPVADCPRSYGAHVTVPQLDLTGPGPVASVNVLTQAGIIGVGARQVSTRTGRLAAVVEIIPNTEHRVQTAPGGNWETEVRDYFGDGRLEIALTRQDGGETLA